MHHGLTERIRAQHPEAEPLAKGHLPLATCPMIVVVPPKPIKAEGTTGHRASGVPVRMAAVRPDQRIREERVFFC